MPAITRDGCAAVAHTARDQARMQLQVLYQDGRGWCQLSYCNGDPRFEKLTVSGWYQWPRQAHELLDCASFLAEQYGNVYISQCLHTKRERIKSTALPSRVLWCDDVPAGDDYSAVVRSSAASRQAYIVIDTPLPYEERSALQRRWRATVGGDPASADAIKPVRLSGGYNTKRHDHFPVTLESASGTVYKVDQLTARWPELASRDDIGTFDALDIAAVELKRGNINALIARANKTLPDLARRELHGRGTAPTTSEARFRVIYGLVSVGFPDDEIGALLAYWHDTGALSWGSKEGKGLKIQTDDISRCIAKSVAKVTAERDRCGKTLNRIATRGATELPPAPLSKSTARKDRPQTITAAAYLDWVHANLVSGMLLMTRAECAAEHHTSVKTIQRLEDLLGLKRKQWEQHGSYLRVDNIAVPPTNNCTHAILRVDNIAVLPTKTEAENELRVDNIAVVSTLKNARSALPDAESSQVIDSRITPPLSCLDACPVTAPTGAAVHPENSVDAVTSAAASASGDARPADVSPRQDACAAEGGGVLLHDVPIGISSDDVSLAQDARAAQPGGVLLHDVSVGMSSDLGRLSALRTLVRAAFDAVPRDYANVQTGVLGNVTVKRVMAYVAEQQVSFGDDELRDLVVEERYRREALALKELSLNGLRAELRKAESMLQVSKKRNEPTAWLLVRIDKLKAEMRTRPPEPEPVKLRRRVGGPVRPDQRAAGVAYQQALLDDLDAALGRGRLRA